MWTWRCSPRRKTSPGYWPRWANSMSGTPERLIGLAHRFPNEARAQSGRRPLLRLDFSGKGEALREALDAEARAEQAKDRAYWAPLRAGFESFRRGARGWLSGSLIQSRIPKTEGRKKSDARTPNPQPGRGARSPAQGFATGPYRCGWWPSCPMPLGFAPTEYARPGQVFVPEGHSIIAQRFNVGNQRPWSDKSRRDG